MPEVTTPIEPSEDTISILVTTDNHVGYKENDPIIGDDAWKSFEEIMGIAKENDVDMVLQSGDLFHINKPSKKSLFQVMRVLRSNCLGDRPCELELLSDPSETLDDGFNVVNYEDPNINVSIPVFAISGNHDDSTGDSLLSPMDVLNVSGLVNHFGRVLKNDDITVTPMLLQKGTTKLALYGLASVLDERLFRTFRDGQVKFKTPSVRKGEWFNLMAVHQNHHAHTETSYLPENFLPSFLDLVVWGHEHECIPYTVTNFETNFETLQPGSSVATSLSDAETVEKHVFIINIKNRNYHVQPVKLKTVRPFVMRDISLSNSGIMPGSTSRPQVTRYLTSKVNELITEAKQKWREQNPELFEGDSEVDVEQEEEREQEQEQGEANDEGGASREDKRYPLPLIRLRVDYSGGYEVENPRRFSNMFVGKVANVNDIILFHRRKDTNSSRQKNIKLKDVVVEENASIKVQSFVNSFLQESQLSLLPEIGINAAVKNFVDKEDKSALETFVNRELQNDIRMLSRTEIEEDDELINYIKKHKKNFAHMAKTVEAHSSEDKKSRSQASKSTTARRKTASRSAKSSEIVASGSDDNGDNDDGDGDGDGDGYANMDDRPHRSVRTAESSEPAVPTAAASRKRSRVAPKPRSDPVEVFSDSGPEEQPPATQRKTTTRRKEAPSRTKPVAPKRGARKRHDSSDEEEDGGDGGDDYDDYDSGDDSEDEEARAPAKKKRNTGKPAPVEDDENDMDSKRESAPAAKTSRKRGAIATSTRGRGKGRERGKAGGGGGGSQSIDQLLSQFGRR